MQCKLRFPLLQHMISISTRSMFPAPPSHADFDPFPAQPCIVGSGGGVPRRPPHRFFALPLPALPCPVKKIASPSIPGRNLLSDIWPAIHGKIMAKKRPLHHLILTYSLPFFIDCGHIYVPNRWLWGSTSWPHLEDLVMRQLGPHL